MTSLKEGQDENIKQTNKAAAIIFIYKQQYDLLPIIGSNTKELVRTSGHPIMTHMYKSYVMLKSLGVDFHSNATRRCFSAPHLFLPTFLQADSILVCMKAKES